MKKLWVEKHRPKTIEEVIFANEKVKNIFRRYVLEQEIPNLLLQGIQGTGKTTISKALINELKINSSDVMRINCSDEKIDALRDKVTGFANTMPLGKFKIVQLEEFDMLGQVAQGLLRVLIEDVSDTCRFIATCNYINKITPPLRSRFEEFSFKTPQRDEVILKMAEILEIENIQFEIDDLEKIVAAGYPDIRKTILLLDAGSKSGKLLLTGGGISDDWKLQLLPLLELSNITACRKLVCESANKDELQDIFRFLYDNIHKSKRILQFMDEALCLLAKYQFQDAFVADKEINIAALFCELDLLGK